MNHSNRKCYILGIKRIWTGVLSFFVIIATSVGLFCFASSFRSDAASGDLDPSFGTGGKVVTFFPDNNEPRKIAVQPDGKIVVLGQNYDHDYNNFTDFLGRYNPDGTVDTSFGMNGRVLIPYQTQPFGFLRDGPVILPNGKILVCGNQYVAANRTVFIVLRFNGNGSLDTSFGTNGSAIASFGTDNDRWDSGEHMLVQPDGRIVVAGYAENNCVQDPFEGYYCQLEA